MRREAMRLALPLLLAAAALLAAAPARACGDDGDGAPAAAAAAAAPWDREIALRGRRRSLLSLRGRRCGAVPPAPGVLRAVQFALAAHAAKEAARAPAAARQGPTTYTIPLHLFNVVSSDGKDRGYVSDAGLKGQVDALNAAYATAVAPDGSVGNSAGAAGITWKFDLQGITRVKAGDMCDQKNEKEVKTANRKGDKGALNLYITDLSSCGLLGYSTWPWELDPKSGKQDALTMDGVVIHFETLPGGSYKPYNEGRTCIHETGHWMGLFHVFQNGCSKGGDQVDDTPYQASPSDGCPSSRDSCPQPGSDPFWNFMDYTDDRCMKGFTPGQHKRMEAMRQLHRQG
ncbi:zinc metalloprotease [Raphidocelis subcapitata]|uniref:Zinc metalloprotease n=1 Tax=Raphidocelis subcapitata TaxID=307507 RepID=A0A2V0NU39_9CHLO|nr:zinc metalloprotease [Raphidocelis subcapitata]|eukprot:GBF91178.1 zinc metalloprotease [Raphidocelis subcapitata]